MSDEIRHECGIAFLRLRKSLSYYHQTYGTAFYGLNKLYLMMEKQHNRGQDGAGIATVKLNVQAGTPFMKRIRCNNGQNIADIFKQVQNEIEEVEKLQPDIRMYPELMKGYLSYMGEVMLGHLRYGTQGRNNIEYCHPFIKSDINPLLNLCLAGNFNLVNTKELFHFVHKDELSKMKTDSDLSAMMEIIHYFLREEVNNNPDDIQWKEVLSKACSMFDGGFVAEGICGNGDSFILRDKHGIRPAYYYIDDEIVAAASERPVLMTAFKTTREHIIELPAGHALIVKANGSYSVESILPQAEKKSCSFERIYFSRGSDEDIYKERKQLGRLLSEKVLKSIKYDLKNTIFSFIPNTAETAFYGLIKGAEAYLNEIKVNRIQAWDKNFDETKLREMIERRVRIEKIAIKDVKMRTFITEDAARNEMVQHVYDITYGTVRAGIDSLVVIDDSIVRGTTLKESIIRMLDRLGPNKITIVSSAPQIRYPDCYGIDMSKMGEFIAFQATVELLKDHHKTHILTDVYADCLQAEKSNKLTTQNFVKRIYKQYSIEEINVKIAQMLRTSDVNADVEIIYQTIENLHEACPDNQGDWYFTGDYPTPGGNVVVNKAFMNYMEGNVARGY
ncbi:MAG: amidophosphoribosyltransferase [Bacteroidetes bacterium]|jgi:amidophosphoribosyltransferase|nr:amidophosphoribosyltransferase [Bacteroidota bacterium]MBK6818325.1 amidophosphoribosyltransferase [Bacteroidota bacterium]MBK7040461.1 amidophosphoribosyltransferase [Bacteroidota bacterium]MBK7587200.1 amidophosphoribosyltransferase [Bacteroidota bacterium]MBK8328275.1 amidophosphoribosyltransferase [Bacteroidota bacterium]